MPSQENSEEEEDEDEDEEVEVERAGWRFQTSNEAHCLRRLSSDCAALATAIESCTLVFVTHSVFFTLTLS